MTMSISFPNLGINLQNVGKSFSVFGFEIAFYGVIIGLGILAGVLMAVSEAKRTGQDTELYYDLAIYAVIFSVIGARLYYIIFSWDSYKDDLLSIFNLRAGGLAIYGGVIAAIITVYVFSRIKKVSFGLLTDTAGLGLILGQIIGRWGNFFNREAFGEYTDSFLAMRLPIDAVRYTDVTEKMREHLELIDGISYIQVHPTFLYESLWNVAVLAGLLIWRKYKKFDGEVFLMYLIGYGVGRFWIEGLRTDQLLIPGIGWPVSQVLAAVMAVGSAIAIVCLRKKAKHRNEMESTVSRLSSQ